MDLWVILKNMASTIPIHFVKGFGLCKRINMHMHAHTLRPYKKLEHRHKASSIEHRTESMFSPHTPDAFTLEGSTRRH